MKNKIITALVLALPMILLAFISKPKNKYKNLTADVVIAWNLISHETMEGKDYNCLIATRIHSMVHLAMHDAINSIHPLYETYALKAKNKSADPEATAAVAAYTVLLE